MSAITSTAPGEKSLIEPASWRDLNELRHLEQVCFSGDAWPLIDLLGVLTLPGVVRLKAVRSDRMVGFVAADIRRSQRIAWIATIAVLPDFRRQGIGAALLLALEARLDVPRLKLNVRVSNLPAIRLYERCGFKRTGSWSNYYQDGEEALIFEKAL